MRLSFFLLIFFTVTVAQAGSKGVLTENEPFRGKTSPQPGTVISLGSEYPRILGTQVSLFYCDDLKEVERRIRGLAEGGVNTLILRVFHNRGDRPYQFANPQHPTGVYFQTGYAPMVDDILGPVARLAHRHGLRVFAWMTTRYANYGFEDTNGLRGLLYDFEKRTLVPAKGFNLFRREVATRLEGLYSDLARYPIDGILFQDDLILRHNEGFSPEARKLFSEAHGYLPDPSLLYRGISRDENGKVVVSGYTDRFWIWARWKNLKMLNVAKMLMNAARKVKPGLLFGTNIYYESILEPEKAMAWYSQSLEVARDFPFDYFSVMAYHRQMQDELNLATMEETLNLVGHLTERAVEIVGEPARVLMKVQVVDWKDSKLLPREETEIVLKTVGEKPGIHVAVVPYQPDFPMDVLIRSVTPRRVQAKEKRDSISSTAMREPLPRSYPR